MLKQLTAIALGLLLASPVRALMAEGMNGFPVPPSENKLLLLIGIDATLTDGNCYGYGAYRFYRPDMAISVRTIDGIIYDSVRPTKTVILETGRCNYIATVKIPKGLRFYLSISGVIIPGELYNIRQEENDGFYFAHLSDIDLSELSSKGLIVGE